MTTSTLTLTEFLLARIAEDEAQAHRSLADLKMNPNLRIPADWITGTAARVLAECEAKRRIVELHPILGGWEDEDMNDHGPGCETCGHSEEYADTGGACETLRALASVYADHPDYRDEWRA